MPMKFILTKAQILIGYRSQSRIDKNGQPEVLYFPLPIDDAGEQDSSQSMGLRTPQTLECSFIVRSYKLSIA